MSLARVFSEVEMMNCSCRMSDRWDAILIARSCHCDACTMLSANSEDTIQLNNKDLESERQNQDIRRTISLPAFPGRLRPVLPTGNLWWAGQRSSGVVIRASPIRSLREAEQFGTGTPSITAIRKDVRLSSYIAGRVTLARPRLGPVRTGPTSHPSLRLDKVVRLARFTGRKIIETVL